MGSLQAWDSHVQNAGVLTVFIVSLAIALPPVALLVRLKQVYILGAFVLSSISWALRCPRTTSMGLIFSGIIKQNTENVSGPWPNKDPLISAETAYISNIRKT